MMVIQAKTGHWPRLCGNTITLCRRISHLATPALILRGCMCGSDANGDKTYRKSHNKLINNVVLHTFYGRSNCDCLCTIANCLSVYVFVLSANENWCGHQGFGGIAPYHICASAHTFGGNRPFERRRSNGWRREICAENMFVRNGHYCQHSQHSHAIHDTRSRIKCHRSGTLCAWCWPTRLNTFAHPNMVVSASVAHRPWMPQDPFAWPFTQPHSLIIIFVHTK